MPPPPELRRLRHPNPDVDRLIQSHLSSLEHRPVPELQRGSSTHTVFVNNPLKLEYIDVLGMDYDYTLGRY